LIIEKDKKPVFVKRIISCPLKKLSIPEFIKLQAENLLELDDLDFVPRLEFYTLDSIGMTYFENSKTIKQIFMEGDSLPDYLVDDIISKARLLVNRLGQKKMNYDLSVNNILVRDGSVFFVDFDYSRRRASVSRLKFVLENLISGDMFFDSRGKLRTSSPLTKILFFLRGVYD
jgi:predicted Ser/Thr protein kinase